MGAPPWAFLVLLAALTLLLVVRTGEHRLRLVTVFGSIALAVLVQIWFHHGSTEATLWRDLAVPVLFTIALSLVAAHRAPAPVNANEDEGSVVAATLVAALSLLGCVLDVELGSDPRPLFAALAVYVVLLGISARRRDWTWLVLFALMISAFHAHAWQLIHFKAEDLPLALPIYAGFYLAFLELPFALTATVARGWKERPLPWISSALAGPAFFFPLYRAVVLAWGDATIGALPLILAAFSVAAVAGVRRALPPPAGGAPGRRRRPGN